MYRPFTLLLLWVVVNCFARPIMLLRRPWFDLWFISLINLQKLFISEKLLIFISVLKFNMFGLFLGFFLIYLFIYFIFFFLFFCLNEIAVGFEFWRRKNVLNIVYFHNNYTIKTFLFLLQCFAILVECNLNLRNVIMFLSSIAS